MSFFKKPNFGFILITVLVFVLGWQLGHYDYNLQLKNYRPTFNVTNQVVPQNVPIDFKLFWQTWDLVFREYVDKKALDPQKMFYGAIQGMVAAAGDPYTVFLPPDSQKSTKEQLNGSFDGVGIQLGYNKDKRLVVIAPLQGTPADKAGIKAGDIIVKIDSKDTTAISLPDAVNAIRGPRGSSIALEIYRDGETKTRTITIQRDTIIVKSVELQTKTTPGGKKVGLIKLSQFGERTDNEWNQAVVDALASGSQAIILDVRNNPGGLLDGAVYIGSEFIKSGNVVQQEDSRGNRQGYPVNRQGKLLNLPMVVLINKGSASASEIVAGAIQDNKRGTLVGEQSFGKGTIQSAEDLPNGTGIHITTAKWLTPNGRWIHQVGLTPDVKVDAGDDQSKDPQLLRALELLDR
ncbi:S41 family peptidase [Candidatus Daviesbacteria bacterium]|nr:S41 family peptidase [Candidatus Daviesbacteria bacterium]